MFLLLLRLRRVCDKALAAADLAPVLACELRMTREAAFATFINVFRLGDFLCDKALAAAFLAFLLAV